MGRCNELSKFIKLNYLLKEIAWVAESYGRKAASSPLSDPPSPVTWLKSLVWLNKRPWKAKTLMEDGEVKSPLRRSASVLNPGPTTVGSQDGVGASTKIAQLVGPAVAFPSQNRVKRAPQPHRASGFPALPSSSSLCSPCPCLPDAGLSFLLQWKPKCSSGFFLN